MTRREFIASSAAAVCGAAFPAFPRIAFGADEAAQPFLISLAEWSLVKTLRAGRMTNLDFPRAAKREFGIDCIEFVDQFFADKAKDTAYLGELKRRAEEEGVRIGLIMLDTNGPLGAEDATQRARAIEITRAWMDAAAFLGCATVRVNARGAEHPEELGRLIADSCAKLADYAAPLGLNLAIENHGGPSSDPVWLAGVMRAVDKPNFGALPDFGNFPPEVDRYDAVEALMPWAKAVSAKAMGFTVDGGVAETDFHRMMRIVRDGGYTGYVGVESGAPDQEREADAVRMTRELLLGIREAFTRRTPLFNGRGALSCEPGGGSDEKDAHSGGARGSVRRPE
ncbi:MAG TPA: TIM barrel protein [Candidatus Hydrogenedentes bacterium]|nr:TIM barrel protein [Candidatus Hydrogenedentota bacterium]